MVDMFEAVPADKAIEILDELHRAIEGTYGYAEESAWYKARVMLQLEATTVIGKVDE